MVIIRIQTFEQAKFKVRSLGQMNRTVFDITRFLNKALASENLIGYIVKLLVRKWLLRIFSFWQIL